MQLVATDLDGTIVAADGTVSARTVAALRACERAGIPVVIVTGRPPRWLPSVLSATGLGGLAICANGAVVYDCATQRIATASTIPLPVVEQVVGRLRAELSGMIVALETTAGFVREPGYHATFHDLEQRPRLTFEQMLAAEPAVVKILIRADGFGDDLVERARRSAGELIEATHSNARDNLLELGPAGVSKAVTLAKLCADRAIAAESVVAFGDQPNDVPMLRWAGLGYAMADGHPEAIAAADAIAPPCTDDGVAQVLEARLGGRG